MHRTHASSRTLLSCQAGPRLCMYFVPRREWGLSQSHACLWGRGAEAPRSRQRERLHGEETVVAEGRGCGEQAGSRGCRGVGWAMNAVRRERGCRRTTGFRGRWQGVPVAEVQASVEGQVVGKQVVGAPAPS